MSRPSSALVPRPASAARGGPRPSSRWQAAGDALIAANRMRRQPQQQQLQQQPTALVEAAPRTVSVIEAASSRPASAARGGSYPLAERPPSQNTLATLPTPKPSYGYGNKIVNVPPPSKQQLASASFYEEQATKRKAQYGAAALDSARSGDSGQLRKILMEEPASAVYVDECKVTPLMLASAYGHGQCVELLLGAGANVDRVNAWGSTPLINAAHNAKHAVVKMLLQHEASPSIRDKDGTAFDNALGRLNAMLSELAANTDPTHPDKPGLVAAAKRIKAVSNPKGRPDGWKGLLFEGLNIMKEVLDRAAALLAASQEEDDEEGENEGGKEKPDGEPPSAGVMALYKGCGAYAKCIVLLNNPAKVRMQGKAASSALALTDEKERDGLTQRVGRIRTALALEVGLSLPEHIARANAAMGFEPSGSLPQQADRLVRALGID